MEVGVGWRLRMCATHVFDMQTPCIYGCPRSRLSIADLEPITYCCVRWVAFATSNIAETASFRRRRGPLGVSIRRNWEVSVELGHADCPSLLVDQSAPVDHCQLER
jgi:hypothetical protein